MERACVFVDGENLRHALVELLTPLGFSAAEYLPHNAKWGDFFDWIVVKATGAQCKRLRAYWFVTEGVDCYPFGFGELLNPANQAQLQELLSQHKPYKTALNGLVNPQLAAKLKEQVDELKKEQAIFEKRFNGWHTVQDGISRKHHAVEFRRAGNISYRLFDKKLGKEKAVDVRLACDAIVLKKIYETAIIVSGDQDYVPAARILKDAGKTVINVAFEKPDGKLLPGGARRLNIITDSSLNVPFADLRAFMGY